MCWWEWKYRSEDRNPLNSFYCIMHVFLYCISYMNCKEALYLSFFKFNIRYDPSTYLFQKFVTSTQSTYFKYDNRGYNILWSHKRQREKFLKCKIFFKEWSKNLYFLKNKMTIWFEILVFTWTDICILVLNSKYDY